MIMVMMMDAGDGERRRRCEEMEKCMAGLVNGLFKWSTRKVRIGKSR